MAICMHCTLHQSNLLVRWLGEVGGSHTHDAVPVPLLSVCYLVLSMYRASYIAVALCMHWLWNVSGRGATAVTTETKPWPDTEG